MSDEPLIRDAAARAQLPSDLHKIAIYTMSYDNAAGDQCQLKCRATIDGKEVQGLMRATIDASADFTRVTLDISPAEVTLATLSADKFHARELPRP